MKTPSNQTTRSCTALLAALLSVALLSPIGVQAKQGATDPIPGSSKGATNSGGGGGGGGGKSSTTTTPTPAPAPAPVPQPILVAPLTFTASSSQGLGAVCTGSYRLDPYYATLSLMTVSVDTSSLNVPDGTLLYVTVNVVAGSGTGYPFTSNVILITGGSGSCILNEYITPGSIISSVVVSDDIGASVFVGQ